MKPIANKYREGKLKSTLERELKGRETIWKEADRAGGSLGNSSGPVLLHVSLQIFVD